jgi:hypothetical protein
VPSLHEIQCAFGRGLLSGEAAGIARFIVANGIDPASRLQVYRNNMREGFLATLRAGYPVLERLVGEQYFHQLVLEYHASCPSPSGNLHHAGRRLPAFLVEKFAGTEYAYFPDVARLEWAMQEVLVAADAAVLDVERLRSIPPGDYTRLVFRLHPAAALVSSGYPILSIWQANQAEAADQAIDLDLGAEHVLLVRTDEAVELRRLSPPQFALLASIADGETLERAIDRALTEGAFDAAAHLREYVAAGVIVDFELANGESQ